LTLILFTIEDFFSASHSVVFLRHCALYKFTTVVLMAQCLGIGLVIERSLVRLPAGALSSQLGQFSLLSFRGK